VDYIIEGDRMGITRVEKKLLQLLGKCEVIQRVKKKKHGMENIDE
jgi:hypothetical protein